VDVLSEVLHSVKLSSALFFNGEFSSPWCFRSPNGSAIVPYLESGAGHVIVYHVVLSGSAWARVGDGPEVALASGDVVMFPHGDAHLMGHGTPIDPVDNEKQLRELLSGGLGTARMGGGGELTHFVCGFMFCDRDLSALLFSGLPPLLRINIRDAQSGSWLENALRFAIAQTGAPGPGGRAVLAKLSEALFVETVRHYLTQMPAEQTGWLAGTRDPDVGRALALIHKDVTRCWTLPSLATAVGVSRAVLAERFRIYLGESPTAYLTRWRLRLAAQLLTGTARSVAQVAAEVGYDSEAAFNRAFKRAFNDPPARYRKASRTSV